MTVSHKSLDQVTREMTQCSRVPGASHPGPAYDPESGALPSGNCTNSRDARWVCAKARWRKARSSDMPDARRGPANATPREKAAAAALTG